MSVYLLWKAHKYHSLHKKRLLTVPMCSLGLFQLFVLLLCVTPSRAPLMNPAITWPDVPDYPLRAHVCVLHTSLWFVIRRDDSYCLVNWEQNVLCSYTEQCSFSFYVAVWWSTHAPQPCIAYMLSSALLSGCMHVCFGVLLCPYHLATICHEQAGEHSQSAVISSCKNVRNSVCGVGVGRA